ncbi:MAG: glycosyltransferase [Dysgonamonadaceae bacterium]|jgi:glycosyltransferase involved in cell wall biosynthesis|nr:glycosyltransferase [Dysgonamonadaceae bacterium]
MKLSIITINLNNREGLKKTVESVVSQTLTDFEYIIIDGGSTDGSVELIKQYTNRITFWISEPDKGIYNAMNKAIVMANGEYCQFLNSGDYLYDKTVLEKVFSQGCNEDIIVGNYIEFSSANRWRLQKGRIWFCSQEGRQMSVFDLFLSKISHQASFIRRSLFDKYGLYDENCKITADWLFYFRTIGLGDVSHKHIDLPVVFFDMNGMSNSMPSGTAWNERMDAYHKLLPANILKDYLHFMNMEFEFHYVKKYRITRLIVHFLNILVSKYDSAMIRFCMFCEKHNIKTKHRERFY